MVENITKWKLKIIGLYRSSYVATFHIREMANLLKTSHVTLLPHLKGLEKDRILEVKTAGKNRVYSLNSANIAVKEHIAIAEKAESLEFIGRVFVIKKIYSDMAKFDLPGCIVLFGSYAKGYFTKESDIDLLYIGDIRENQAAMIEQAGKIYNKKISLKKSTLKNFEEGLRKKDPLTREILKSHFVLQNADLFVGALWRYFNEIR